MFEDRKDRKKQKEVENNISESKQALRKLNNDSDPEGQQRVALQRKLRNQEQLMRILESRYWRNKARRKLTDVPGPDERNPWNSRPKDRSPERATEVVSLNCTLSLFQSSTHPLLFPGVSLRFTPGYHLPRLWRSVQHRWTTRRQFCRLLCRNLSVYLQIARRGGIVGDFNWSLPNQSLDATGARVVFATVDNG